MSTVNKFQEEDLMRGIKVLVVRYSEEHAEAGTGPACALEWADGTRVKLPFPWHITKRLADITGHTAVIMEDDNSVLMSYRGKR